MSAPVKFDDVSTETVGQDPATMPSTVRFTDNTEEPLRNVLYNLLMDVSRDQSKARFMDDEEAATESLHEAIETLISQLSRIIIPEDELWGVMLADALTFAQKSNIRNPESNLSLAMEELGKSLDRLESERGGSTRSQRLK